MDTIPAHNYVPSHIGCGCLDDMMSTGYYTCCHRRWHHQCYSYTDIIEMDTGTGETSNITLLSSSDLRDLHIRGYTLRRRGAWLESEAALSSEGIHDYQVFEDTELGNHLVDFDDIAYRPHYEMRAGRITNSEEPHVGPLREIPPTLSNSSFHYPAEDGLHLYNATLDHYSEHAMPQQDENPFGEPPFQQLDGGSIDKSYSHDETIYCCKCGNRMIKQERGRGRGGYYCEADNHEQCCDCAYQSIESSSQHCAPSADRLMDTTLHYARDLATAYRYAPPADSLIDTLNHAGAYDLATMRLTSTSSVTDDDLPRSVSQLGV